MTNTFCIVCPNASGTCRATTRQRVSTLEVALVAIVIRIVNHFIGMKVLAQGEHLLLIGPGENKSPGFNAYAQRKLWGNKGFYEGSAPLRQTWHICA